MKIYEIATGYTPIPAKVGAATEIVVEELARAFAAQNQDITVIDVDSDTHGNLPFPVIGIKLPKIFSSTTYSLGAMHKLKRVWYSCALAFKIKKILKDTEGKAILHFHNQYNFYFTKIICGDLLKKKATVLYTVHSYIWSRPWEEIKTAVTKKYFMEIVSIKNADFTFVLNEKIHSTITANILHAGGSLYLIANGVNTHTYSSQVEFSSLNDNITIIHVGSVCDRKNQLGIIQQITPLLKSGKGSFHYAGGIISQEYQDKIASYAEAEGISQNIKYHGEIKPGRDLNAFYNSGSCFIFDSKSEAFSLVILEAMSAGLPVFLNNSQRIAFLSGENCGITYFSDFDLINKIHEICDNKDIRHDRVTQQREFVTSKYSWNAIASAYLQPLNIQNNKS